MPKISSPRELMTNNQNLNEEAGIDRMNPKTTEHTSWTWIVLVIQPEARSHDSTRIQSAFAWIINQPDGNHYNMFHSVNYAANLHSNRGTVWSKHSFGCALLWCQSKLNDKRKFFVADKLGCRAVHIRKRVSFKSETCQSSKNDALLTISKCQMKAFTQWLPLSII